MSHIGLRHHRRLAASLVLLLLSCRSTTAPEEQVMVLDIAAATVPCTGFIPQQCMLVRSRADGPWENFYESIEGFTYESGFFYTVRVAVRVIANPPTDGSSRAFRLLAVLSKTPG